MKRSIEPLLFYQTILLSMVVLWDTARRSMTVNGANKVTTTLTNVPGPSQPMVFLALAGITMVKFVSAC